MARPLSRRQLLGRTASGLLLPTGSLALWPRLARAAEDDEHRFIFIVCEGGWDVLCTLAPLFDSDTVELEELAEPNESGGIPFVSHPDRPSVDRFFETWADRTAVLHGFEVQSVSHLVATEKLLTGQSGGVRDDWMSVIAGASGVERPAPLVVVSGPAYATERASEVVRVGAAGQLPSLISGDVVEAQGLSRLPGDSRQLVEAWVQGRAADRVGGAGRGREARLAETHALMLERARELADMADSLAWSGGGVLEPAQQLETALTALQTGLSRCASIGYVGVWGLGWDTHSTHYVQSWHFEELFGLLDGLMGELSTRSGPDGRALLDSTTVVVCSEMSRDPRFNNSDGRDHWTWSSAMLLGAGVRGGQVFGAYDDDMGGRPIDLDSGEASDSGVLTTSAHLGATLLALADVDPGEHTGGAEPITGILDG